VIVAVANPGYSAGCRKYLQPDGVTFTEVAPPLEIDQERARCEPLSTPIFVQVIFTPLILYAPRHAPADRGKPKR
jgi:hypothetical protein